MKQSLLLLQGRTVLHCAAAEGFIKGIQYIISLRGDSVHDTDKMVSLI